MPLPHKKSSLDKLNEMVCDKIEFADLVEPLDGLKPRRPTIKGLWGAIPSDVRREICTEGFFRCIPWVIAVGMGEVQGIKPELRLKAIDLLGKYGPGEKQEYAVITGAERREIDVRAILLVAEEIKNYKQYQEYFDEEDYRDECEVENGYEADEGEGTSTRDAGRSGSGCVSDDTEESSSFHEIYET